MKTNHQRGFIESRSPMGFIRHRTRGVTRHNRFEGGMQKSAAVFDVPYGGHREMAAAVRHVKTTMRRSERRSLKRLDYEPD